MQSMLDQPAPDFALPATGKLKLPFELPSDTEMLEFVQALKKSR